MSATGLASMLHRRSVAGDVVVRPVASIPGLAEHCEELARQAGVARRDPASFALLGSALRAAWTGETWRDINVALDAEAVPRSIVADGDFTICQVAVHDGHVFHSSRFLDHIAERTIVLNRIDACAPVITLLRMYKHAARGYAVPASEVRRVLEAIRRAPRPQLDAATVLRHGGGVVDPAIALPARRSLTRVRRALHEFPGAPSLVAALRDALDRPAGRRLSYHVHGGFARACVTGEPFTDVDIVAASRADRDVLRSLSAQRLRLRGVADRELSVRVDIGRRAVPSPAALIGEMDLVMARLAFSTIDDCFHMDPDCLEAIATRTLSLRHVSSRRVTPSRTIGRTLKYAARGFRLPLVALLSALEEHRRTPAIVRWGEYGLRVVLQRRALAAGQTERDVGSGE